MRLLVVTILVAGLLAAPVPARADGGDPGLVHGCLTRSRVGSGLYVIAPDEACRPSDTPLHWPAIPFPRPRSFSLPPHGVLTTGNAGLLLGGIGLPDAAAGFAFGFVLPAGQVPDSPVEVALTVSFEPFSGCAIVLVPSQALVRRASEPLRLATVTPADGSAVVASGATPEHQVGKAYGLAPDPGLAPRDAVTVLFTRAFDAPQDTCGGLVGITGIEIRYLSSGA